MFNLMRSYRTVPPRGCTVVCCRQPARASLWLVSPGPQLSLPALRALLPSSHSCRFWRDGCRCPEPRSSAHTGLPLAVCMAVSPAWNTSPRVARQFSLFLCPEFIELHGSVSLELSILGDWVLFIPQLFPSSPSGWF